MLGLSTETHHALNARTVVPGTVEEDDLASAWKVLDVALEVPGGGLTRRRLFQSDSTSTTRIQVLVKTLNGAALTSGVTAFEEDDVLLTSFLGPVLPLQKLNLQLPLNRLIFLARHALLVRVAIAPGINPLTVWSDQHRIVLIRIIDDVTFGLRQIDDVEFLFILVSHTPYPTEFLCHASPMRVPLPAISQQLTFRLTETEGWDCTLRPSISTARTINAMLLSEALAARSEVSDRLAEINRRLALVAQVQEGDTPDEDPQALIAEAERLMARFEWLVRSINATNSATAFEDGTLSDALAKRDHLLTRRRFYTSAADQGSGRRDRYSASEIRYVATVDIRSLRQKADQASKEYRDLDTRIQQANWSTELIEAADKPAE